MAKKANTKPDIHGVVAEFEGPDQLLEAAKQAHAAGYRQMDAYSPFPVHGIGDWVGKTGQRMPLMILIGGLSGAIGGFLLQTYATVVDYPYNIGGRPAFSWPSYIPITFELTILGAVLTTVFGMLLLNGLPQFYHPIFNTPNFEAASTDRFFLCIESHDPQFDRAQTARFLESLNPASVSEVEW
jgi:hypothetical protein